MAILVAENENQVLQFSLAKYKGKTINKSDFLSWKADDGFLYEWNKGVLEAIEPMKQEEMYIIRNIEDKFFQTQAFKQKARLFSEINCWVNDQQMRIPDMAFYTHFQIQKTAQKQSVIPTFIIEIISEFDQINKVEVKLVEYFRAGVQVVWRIFPELKIVYGFTSPKKANIYTDDDLLDASPVIPDLKITIEELFKI